jgi:hypothetical protein
MNGVTQRCVVNAAIVFDVKCVALSDLYTIARITPTFAIAAHAVRP